MLKSILYFFAKKIFLRASGRIACASSILFLLLVNAVPAYADATCTANMQNVEFGAVNVTTGVPVDVTATLQVTCSDIAPATTMLCINFGATAIDDQTSRKLPFGASDTIRYNLYTNSGRSTLWGSWADGYQSAGLEIVVPNGTMNIPVYARLLGSQQQASSGFYTMTDSMNPSIDYGAYSAANNCPSIAAPGNHMQASFTVEATVQPSCTVATNDMDFGSKNALTSVADSASSVSVQCSNLAPYAVSLGNGNFGSSPTNRKLVQGASRVTYGLYQDAARNTPWGSGASAVGGTGTGNQQTIDVYGRIPIQQTPPPGTYVDSVVVTVTY